MEMKCPHCQHRIELVLEPDSSPSSCPVCGSRIDLLGETQSIRTNIVEVADGFELLDLLGHGHFGDVWKARDRRLDRLVALKFLRRSGSDRETESAAIREAQAVARLRHPNIVAVHEVVTHERDVFIVSELVEGLSLSEYCQVHRLEAREAAELCAKVADALDHAHSKGVIHRDLKPANILVDGQGEPHLTDFGLAKRDGDVITITIAGQVLGTPAYMPPEQAAGRGSDADARSDVYSLGVVLYEMLAGKRPFAGKSKLLLHQVMYDDPPALRSTNAAAPRDLETICFKALEKSPARRYQSAADMAADLRRYLNGEPIQARPVSRVERGYRWLARNPGWSSAIAASLLGVIAMGTFASLRQREVEAFERSSSALQESIATLKSTNEQQERLLKRQTVEIATVPPGAEIVFYPILDGSGLPDFDQRTVFDSGSQATVDLVPGMYFVVAHLPNGDFHEVFRYIPPVGNPSETPLALAHRNFRIRPGQPVVLRPIRIPDRETVEAGMARIPGSAQFETVQGTLKSRFSIPDFLIDCAEVTVAELKRVGVGSPIGFRAKHPDDFPVTGVALDDAIGYAERAGKRLVPGVLFEYAATNMGTSQFPWGNDTAPTPAWELAPVGSIGFDRLMSEPLVSGLLSNAREFTCFSPPSLTIDRTNNLSVSTNSFAMVHGGPKPGTNEADWSATHARSHFSVPIMERNDQVGFRCIRGVRPSLQRSDFFQLIP